jgi:hypothetical protein
MAKAKKSAADASRELYDLLAPFEAVERARIVNSTLLLFGDAPIAPRGAAPAPGSGAQHHTQSQPTTTARAFLDAKDPRQKVEVFATAARFHELQNNGAGATKEDLQRIIQTEGRRAFDARNFARDMGNAQAAKLFNRTSQAGVYTLSHVGQNYVDALPDRSRAAEIKKAARGGGRHGKRAIRRAKQGAK